MNAQMGLMRNKAAGEIEELLKRATEAERKLQSSKRHSISHRKGDEVIWHY